MDCGLTISSDPRAPACYPSTRRTNEPGLVGAETFAAVHPANNRKLKGDLVKLAGRAEMFRYVFFMSPLFPRTERHPRFEVPGVEVWSLEI